MVLACVAGAKGEGEGVREKRKIGEKEIPLLFSLPVPIPYPFDACYAGYSSDRTGFTTDFNCVSARCRVGK